jgi:protein-tyrosine phosphatase
MTRVLSWQQAGQRPAALRQAVQALAAGGLVAFPTETGYGVAASALAPGAVERLGADAGASESLSLVLGSVAAALDWVPGLSPLGRRLARRCWPGPVTLVSRAGVELGLAGRLPEAVRRCVCPAEALHFRVPAHEALREALDHLPGPLLWRAVPGAETSAATTAEELTRAAEGVDLLLDDGPSRFAEAATVVQVEGNSWQILREGVVTAAEVERLCPCLIVFVCTGNTCRSPLAEALCKKLLADRLGCTVEELPRRGFIVLSAGLAAMMGGGPAVEAVAAGQELGADLSGHVSRPLSAKVVAQADCLVAMTHGHLLALADQFAGVGPRPRLLCADGADLPDPIGGDQQVYRDCARQILQHLEGLLAELQPP